MKKLLNTLYVLSEDVYLALDGENVVIFVMRKLPEDFRFIRWSRLSVSRIKVLHQR